MYTIIKHKNFMMYIKKLRKYVNNIIFSIPNFLKP